MTLIQNEDINFFAAGIAPMPAQSMENIKKQTEKKTDPVSSPRFLILAGAPGSFILFSYIARQQVASL